MMLSGRWNLKGPKNQFKVLNGCSTQKTNKPTSYPCLPKGSITEVDASLLSIEVAGKQSLV